MIPPTSSRPRRRGFSIIEVLASGTVMTMTMMAMAMGIRAGTAMYEHQRHLTQALVIGEGTLEELLAAYPGDAALSIGTAGHTTTFNRLGAPASTGVVYTAVWNVQPYAAVPGVGTITVTVSWVESSGLSRNFSFTTYRAL